MDDEQPAATARDDHDPAVLTVEVAGISHTLRPGDDTVTIGREPPSQILVAGPGISRTHVRIQHADEHWSLTDAGSRNGIFLDGQRINHVVVGSSMTLHLGDPDGVALQIIPHHPVDPAEQADVDVEILRAGAAVAARREELGLSVVALAGDTVDPDDIVRFEQGTQWPDDESRAALEQRLRWPADVIAGIRAGDGPPDDEFTEVLSPTVQVSVAVDATDIAVRAIRARAALLPVPTDELFGGEVTQMLAELRRLDRTVAAAARNAPGRLEVAVALTAVRRLRAEVVVRAAQSPQATLGQRLSAVRHGGGLSVAEVATAAGVTVADVESTEAEQHSSDPVVSALERFVTVVAPSVDPYV